METDIEKRIPEGTEKTPDPVEQTQRKPDDSRQVKQFPRWLAVIAVILRSVFVFQILYYFLEFLDLLDQMKTSWGRTNLWHQFFSPSASVNIVTGLLGAAAVIIMLQHRRKDRMAGVCLSIYALCLAVSLALNFSVSGIANIPVILLFAVMAVDCFAEIRLSERVKKLLYGWGVAVLYILPAIAVAIWGLNEYGPNVLKYFVKTNVWYFLRALGDSLLGFAVACARPERSLSPMGGSMKGDISAFPGESSALWISEKLKVDS